MSIKITNKIEVSNCDDCPFISIEYDDMEDITAMKHCGLLNLQGSDSYVGYYTLSNEDDYEDCDEECPLKKGKFEIERKEN